MENEYGACKRPCQMYAWTVAQAEMSDTVQPLGGDQVKPCYQEWVRRLGIGGRGRIYTAAICLKDRDCSALVVLPSWETFPVLWVFLIALDAEPPSIPLSAATFS